MPTGMGKGKLKDKYVILVHPGKHDYYYQKDNGNVDGLTKLCEFFGEEKSQRFFYNQSICLITGSNKDAVYVENKLSDVIGMTKKAGERKEEFDPYSADKNSQDERPKNVQETGENLIRAIQSLYDGFNVALILVPNDILDNFSDSLGIMTPGCHDYTKITYMRFKQNMTWADLSRENVRYSEITCVNGGMPLKNRVELKIAETINGEGSTKLRLGTGNQAHIT